MSEPASEAAPRPGRWLDRLERAGNALPNPITLFVILALAVLVASAIAAAAGVSVTSPKDGTSIAAINLLGRDGLRRIFTEAVKNFMGFAPLGMVLVSMIGVGVAERAGLLGVLLRATAMGVPRGMLTATIVFIGVMANLATDAGIVLLPPLAALLFLAVGRHPLAGMAAAFAGVSGGFSANLIPSMLDVLLTGFTQEAIDGAKLMPGYHVQVLGNWWFLAVSTPLLTILGTWITHRFVEPRLGPWTPEEGAEVAPALTPLSPGEKRGLRWAGLGALVVVAGMLLLVVPPGAPLRGEGHGLIEQLRPFFDSFVVQVLLLFLVPGVAYGIASGSIRSDRDLATMVGETLASMGTYVGLAFVAAQFVSWFSWSNLGPIVAISGAHALHAAGLHGAGLILAFIVLTAALDLLMPSASAKWALMAPVFVPMFALLGFSPEATQAIYRVPDSTTNIVSPLMPYLPFLLTCAQKYQRRAGVGTLLSLMLPYSLAFLAGWTLLLLAFYAFGWPLGPGVGFGI